MTEFVIRSMTTTDYRIGKYGQQPKPYHIYLMKPECRSGAYWNAGGPDIMTFSTIEAARSEIDRCLPRKASYEPLFDIVPKNDALIPTFWDTREQHGNNARVINDQIVKA